jgi:hypothetical protein
MLSGFAGAVKAAGTGCRCVMMGCEIPDNVHKIIPAQLANPIRLCQIIQLNLTFIMIFYLNDAHVIVLE